MNKNIILVVAMTMLCTIFYAYSLKLIGTVRPTKVFTDLAGTIALIIHVFCLFMLYYKMGYQQTFNLIYGVGLFLSGAVCWIYIALKYGKEDI